MTDDTSKTTHFGRETIPEGEKAGRVQGVFNSVASKYDIMNDVMSVGIHRVWKDAMMDWLAPRPGQKLLDVAGGTGDISFRFLKRAGHGHATVLDLTTRVAPDATGSITNMAVVSTPTPQVILVDDTSSVSGTIITRSTLPNTGNDAGRFLPFGFGLIVVGGLLLFGSRRRPATVPVQDD